MNRILNIMLNNAFKKINENYLIDKFTQIKLNAEQGTSSINHKCKKIMGWWGNEVNWKGCIMHITLNGIS